MYMAEAKYAQDESKLKLRNLFKMPVTSLAMSGVVLPVSVVSAVTFVSII